MSPGALELKSNRKVYMCAWRALGVKIETYAVYAFLWRPKGSDIDFMKALGSLQDIQSPES